MKPPLALTIAGSDPSGGAGMQADLKTFHQHRVYGASVLTLITAQNTVGVTRVELLSPALVLAQLDAVLSDLAPAAAKTGALGSIAIIEAIASRARSFSFPLIVDPVMISKHGAPLLSADASLALVKQLLPCATLLTPNLHEASAITGIHSITSRTMRDAAQALLDLGARAVLLKGGHLSETDGPQANCLDLLATPSETLELPAPRINTKHTHGTGCSYSAAITARLAQGLSLSEAVQAAKAWLHEAIATNPGLGQGSGPINHFVPTNLTDL